MPVPRMPDPRSNPADYDAFVWDLACGTAPVASAVCAYAAEAGINVGAYTRDIDPRRRATTTADVRSFDYKELYRICPPFLVMLTATCTALSNAALICVEINHCFGTSRPNFRILELGQIEVDSADFWTNRLLSSRSRSTAKEAGPNRSITRTLKSG